MIYENYKAYQEATEKPVRVQSCARCGQDHGELIFKQFKIPIAPEEIAPTVWDYWAECPVSGDPILSRFVPVP